MPPSVKSSNPELVSALLPALAPPSLSTLGAVKPRSSPTAVELDGHEAGDSEARQMLMKYPDRIPVLCEKASRSELPDVERMKLLVPGTMPCGELKYIIHKRVLSTTKIGSDQTIYLFVSNMTPKTGALLSDLYEQHKGADGFLHVVFSVENTLGTGTAHERTLLDKDVAPTHVTRA